MKKIINKIKEKFEKHGFGIRTSNIVNRNLKKFKEAKNG